MKAIFEFKLPEEREEFNLAKDAGLFYSRLHDLREMLRKYRKYEDISKMKPEDLLEKITADFYQITEEVWE